MINNLEFFRKISNNLEHEVINLNKDERLLIKNGFFAISNEPVKRLYYENEGLSIPRYQFIHNFEEFYVVSEKTNTKVFIFGKELFFTYLEKNQLLNVYLYEEANFLDQLLEKKDGQV
ncbi:hypothetical protein IBL99_002949 [Listeria monocytogenes]|nr:hypothetical protein [Listeria monocytogenes]